VSAAGPERTSARPTKTDDTLAPAPDDTLHAALGQVDGTAEPGLVEELEQELAREQQPAATEESGDRWRDALQEIVSGSWTVALGAVLLAVLAGSIMIAFTDEGVQDAAGYFFARPGDLFAALGQAVGGAYSALFQGAVYNFRADSFAAGIRPLTQTLTNATPLVAAGLGVALVPRLTVDESDPSVSVVDLRGRVPDRLIGIAWHRDRFRTQAADAFVTEAQALCRQLAAANPRAA
jgi:simple sugar transport system permease protein